MRYRIVSDSSSDLRMLEDVDYSVVPLHIIVGERDFVDDAQVDLAEMQNALDTYSGKTSTSCPSPDEWEKAFGDAEVVFCVTITSGLSGSCASAKTAKHMYEEAHPDRKVFVFDSLSTGPEMVLIIEKTRECILKGMGADEIYETVSAYQKTTHLYYSLASVNNLAKNGRVNPIVAKGLGLLGIRIVGNASEKGTLQPMDKCRGDKKSVKCLVEHMKKCGYTNGKIIIAHSHNEEAVEALLAEIQAAFGGIACRVHASAALNTYYAEPKSVMIGFEA